MIREHFLESIEVKKASLDALETVIDESAKLFIELFQAGNKVLICGNGGSAADAQHFSAELINRFEKERKPLPGIALTTDSSNLTSIANDYSYDEVFSKQVEALGAKNDLLVAISTSGNSISITNAVKSALNQNMRVIALTGGNGGALATIEDDRLMMIKVPSARTARIQEVHLLIIHTWCAYIDATFS